jgi:Mrp family chromosome partitioning ATPase
VELSGAVLRDAKSGIDVLGMARLAASPLGIVEDPAFANCLAELKSHYDLVVIDSAPVLGIPETQLLAGLADQAVFVVRWGSTKRATAKHAMLELTRAGVPVAGAVLTRVNVKEHARQGYGDAGLSYSKYSRYYAS